MKLPNRWILASGSFLAFVLLSIVVVFSVRAYVIERTVSILLDREVQIDDVIDIEVGKLFGATLQGVRMDHSDARFDADFLLVEINLSDWFSRNEINLTRLLVKDADLFIKPGADNGTTTRRPLIPLEFGFQGLTVRYIDEDQDWRAHLVSCTGSGRSGHSIADLACVGDLNESPFTIKGNYGLPDEAGTREPLDISATWGDLSLTAVGKLDSLFDLTGAEIGLTLKSPTARPLLFLLGIHELRDGDINIQLNLADPLAEDVYDFNVNGAFSGVTVRMQGKTRHVENFDQVDAEFLFSGPSLHEAGAILNELRLAPQPFLASGQFTYTDPELEISALNLQVAQGTLTATALVPELPATKGMRLTIEAKQFRPNFLKPIAEACDLPAEPLDITAEVTRETVGQRVFIDARSATFHVNAMGTINEIPGNADLKTTVRGATLETLGQCFGIRLPGLPVRAAAIVTKKADLITLDKLRLESEVVTITGLANVALDKDYPFDTVLSIKAPDARKLAEGLLEDPGPIRDFPFEAALSAKGSTSFLELERLEITSGEHVGHASGTIGDTSSLHGLDLEISITGDDLQALLSDKERTELQQQPYTLNTRVENQLGTWVVEQLHATIAQTTLYLAARITASQDYAGSTLELTADGKNIENLAGPWLNHPVPALPYAINTEVELDEDYVHVKTLQAIVGEHKLGGDLRFDRPPNFNRTKGQLTLKGPSTTELAGLLGIRHEFLERSYMADARLEGTRSKLRLDKLKVTVGESDLSGKASFANTQPPTIDLKLKSSALYMPLFNPDLITGEEDPPDADDTSVFSSTTLPMAWLDGFEGKLDYEAEEVWTTPEYTTGLRVKLELVEGEATTSNFEWHGDHSTGELDLTLNRMEDQLNLKLDARSSRLPLVWLFAGEALPAEGTMFNASFDTQGTSVKSMMANLNGSIIFIEGPGKIEAGKLDNLFGDFFHTVSRRMVERQSDSRTDIACSAGGITINDGMSDLKPGLVVRTDQVNLYASGNIDLKEEKPKLVFMTKPRTGIGISPAKILAPRLKVGGTLAKPGFSVDSKTSALSAYAAFISGGMSVLATGLWDRVTRSENPCSDLYEAAKKEINVAANWQN